MFKVRLIIATQKYLGGFHLVRLLNYYGVLVIQTFFIKNSIINSTNIFRYLILIFEIFNIDSENIVAMNFLMIILYKSNNKILY